MQYSTALIQDCNHLTGESFLAWRLRHSHSQTAAALALGCARQSVINWENKPDRTLPLYIALACAALSHGIGPMT